MADTDFHWAANANVTAKSSVLTYTSTYSLMLEINW